MFESNIGWLFNTIWVCHNLWYDLYHLTGSNFWHSNYCVYFCCSNKTFFFINVSLNVFHLIEHLISHKLRNLVYPRYNVRRNNDSKRFKITNISLNYKCRAYKYPSITRRLLFPMRLRRFLNKQLAIKRLCCNKAIKYRELKEILYVDVSKECIRQSQPKKKKPIVGFQF